MTIFGENFPDFDAKKHILVVKADEQPVVLDYIEGLSVLNSGLILKRGAALYPAVERMDILPGDVLFVPISQESL